MAIVESSIRPGEMKVDGGGVEAFRQRLSGELVCQEIKVTTPLAPFGTE